MTGAVLARRRPALPTGSPKLRRRFALVLPLALVLLAVYLLWLRDSALVRVERVMVTGLTTEEAPRLRRALTAAARGMTTLHVDEGRLRRAIAGSAVVDRLEVRADFPNTLRIAVVERHAAALLVSVGGRVPVAADGTLLRGLRAPGALPEVRTRRALPPERLEPGLARTLVRVAGAAPRALRRRLQDVRVEQDDGIVVRLRSGPDLVFGSAARLRAKWVSAARVLADPASRGADYVDLRLPERPAAGGLPPAIEDEATSAVPGTATPLQPPAAAPSPSPGALATPPAAAPSPVAPGAGAATPPATSPAAPPTGSVTAPPAPSGPTGALEAAP